MPPNAILATPDERLFKAPVSIYFPGEFPTDESIGHLRLLFTNEIDVIICENTRTCACRKTNESENENKTGGILDDSPDRERNRMKRRSSLDTSRCATHTHKMNLF